MKDYIKHSLQENPDHFILQIGTNEKITNGKISQTYTKIYCSPCRNVN